MDFGSYIKMAKSFIFYLFMLDDITLVKSDCGKRIVNKCNVPGKWLPMSTNVCYGNTDSSFGNITFTRDCDLVDMRLRHLSGGFNTFRTSGNTFVTFGNVGSSWFWTVVTDASDTVVFPTDPLDRYGDYLLDGFSEDDELIFFNTHPPIKVQENEKMRLWFGMDLKKHSDRYSYPGVHCVHVDVACME